MAGINIGKLRRKTLNRVITGVAKTTFLSPSVRALRHDVNVLKDIRYFPSQSKAHLLDIYYPKNLKATNPVLLYMHGGGFTTGSKETHENIGFIYAKLGFIVFNINYRLSPDHVFPAALEDTVHAYRWIIDHAKDYQGDINQLTVSGESAGANLALALSIACTFKRAEPYAKLAWETGLVPKVSQLCCGYYQTSMPDRFQEHPTANVLHRIVTKRVSRAYLGKHVNQPQREHEFADPISILLTKKPDRDLPIFFLAVGSKDVLVNDTYQLEHALLKHPATVWAKYYPNEDHVFHFLPWRKKAHEFWQDNQQFLNEYLFSKDESVTDTLLNLSAS